MWQLVQAELRYNAPFTLQLYAGLALLYALMTTDRLAYVLLLIPVVLAIIFTFKRGARQKWERRSLLLPVKPSLIFGARLVTHLIVVVAAIAIAGSLLMRDVYASLHPVLFWRMLSLFNIALLALIGICSLNDVKREDDERWQRYIYPGLVQFFWIILYTMFIDTGNIARLYELLLPAVYASHRNLIFDTPYGVAALATVNVILLYVNWLLFRRRTVFTCK